MEALLAQGNSEKCKIHFNTAFLAGLDCSSLPVVFRQFPLSKFDYIILIKHCQQTKNNPPSYPTIKLGCCFLFPIADKGRICKDFIKAFEEADAVAVIKRAVVYCNGYRDNFSYLNFIV